MNSAQRFLKSVNFAGRGIAKAWHDEPNFRWEIITAFIVILSALLLKVDFIGVAVIILTCSMVIALELINTMIELISDVLKPRLDQYVKYIKDLTAAAVAVAAVGSIGVALFLLLPPIINLLWQ
ncbi:MAG: diacylglycerol kinase [Candidatus Falkowbacteria bacterium]|nr:diacylglycerol kinase [Candidatus Falkowbacteria bacterium]